MTDEMPAEAKAELEEIVTQTKKGFDLSARLRNRGLRKATITLFLDEDAGVELGVAEDLVDLMGNKVGRERSGIIGRIEEIEEMDAKEKAKASVVKELATLEEERERIVAELFRTSLTLKMQAVPPVIQKDARRKAKQTLKITEKNIPADMQDDFNLSYTAHLMAVVIQNITDNETGAVNDEVTYEDAMEMIDQLPPGQSQRLDQALNKVQFTDAISRTIEGQEDFS